MRRGKMIAAVLTVCAVGAGMTVNAYAASTTFEMRKKTVRLLGILSTSNYQTNVSRGEFAELLVKASNYRETGNRVRVRRCFREIPILLSDSHRGDKFLDVRLSRRKL